MESTLLDLLIDGLIPSERATGRNDAKGPLREGDFKLMTEIETGFPYKGLVFTGQVTRRESSY